LEGDKDRYKIRLLKGKDYHVSLAGEYPSRVSLFDPQGKLIKADEPGAGALAGFEYRPDKDGTHQVLVQDFRACLKIQALDKTGYFLSNAIPMAPAWPLLTSGSGFRQSDPEQRKRANSMT
jgi:hypothetical protein